LPDCFTRITASFDPFDHSNAIGDFPLSFAERLSSLLLIGFTTMPTLQSVLGGNGLSFITTLVQTICLQLIPSLTVTQYSPDLETMML
jgi:hypothetical protein